MKLASAWYFAVQDTTSYVKRNKRAILSALFFVLFGIVIGVIFSLNVSGDEYQSYLNLIMTNTYSPFGVFFKMALFSALCVILCYIYLAGRWARIIPYIIVFYCGFILGRSALLDILICKAVGLLSYLLFVLPCYLALICVVIIFLVHMRQFSFCGLHCLFLKRNFIILKHGLIYLSVCLIIEFLLLVILAGVMKLIFIL